MSKSSFPITTHGFEHALDKHLGNTEQVLERKRHQTSTPQEQRAYLEGYHECHMDVVKFINGIRFNELRNSEKI